MRAARWGAGLCCWVVLLASCAVSVPELSVSSSTGGGGGAAGAGGGGAVDCTTTSDCSDPGCACAPNAPSKFLGPVLFAKGAPISCPASFRRKVLTGFTTLTAQDVTCNDCTCGTEPCGAVGIKAYGDSNCGTPLAIVSPQPEVCQGSFGFAIASVLVSDAQTSALTCSQSGGGVKHRPTPSQNFATICIGDVGPGCGSGGVCVPMPEPPIELCVYAEGQADCPGGFSNKHTVYMGMDDQRTCSDCTCGMPAPTCPTTFDAFSSKDCTTGSFGKGMAGTCFPAPPGNAGKSIKAHVATPCAPGGGTPKGGVEKSSPYTVCCR